jgi:Tfp pilus assembly protein PilP
MMRAIVILLTGLLGLTGCGEQHSDLKQFVKDSENLPRGRIPPLPEVKPTNRFPTTL